MLRGRVWYDSVMQGIMLFSSVISITERRDMGLYEVPLIYGFVGFWDEDYVSQLPYVWYYVVSNMLVRNASPRGHMF